MAKDHYSATPSSPSSAAIASSQPGLASWRPTTARAGDTKGSAVACPTVDSEDAFMRPVRSCKQRERLTKATYRPATCGARHARVAAEAATIASALQKNEKLSALAITANTNTTQRNVQPAHPRSLQPAMAYWTASYVTRDGRTVAEAKLTPPYWPVKQHTPYARLTNNDNDSHACDAAAATTSTRLLLLPPITATPPADKFAPPPPPPSLCTMTQPRASGFEHRPVCQPASGDDELNPIFLYRAITSSIEADASAKGLQVCQIRYYDQEFGTFVLLTPKSVLHSVTCSSYVITVEAPAAAALCDVAAQPSLQTLLPSAAELGRMPYGSATHPIAALLEQPAAPPPTTAARKAAAASLLVANENEKEQEQRTVQLLQDDITAALLQLDEQGQGETSEDAARRREELLRRIGRNKTNTLVVSTQYSQMAEKDQEKEKGANAAAGEADSFRAAVAHVESERSSFFTEAELRRFLAQQLRALQAQVGDLVTAEYISRETLVSEEHTQLVLYRTAQREAHAAALQATAERLQREAEERQRAFEAAIAALELSEAARREAYTHEETTVRTLCGVLAAAAQEKTQAAMEHMAAVEADAQAALTRITVLRVEENLARVLAEREAERRAAHEAAVERLCAQEQAARYVVEDFEWAGIDSLLLAHGMEYIVLQEAEQRARDGVAAEAQARTTLQDEAQGSFLLARQRTAQREAAETAALAELCARIEHLTAREFASRTAVEYGEEDARAVLQRAHEALLRSICEATALRASYDEPSPATDTAHVKPALAPEHEATQSTAMTLTPEAIAAASSSSSSSSSSSHTITTTGAQATQQQQQQQLPLASQQPTAEATTPSSELVPSAPQSSDASEAVSAVACTITSVTVILGVADGAALDELRSQLPAAIKEDIICCLGDAVQHVELCQGEASASAVSAVEGSIIHLNVTHDGRYSDESMQQAISRYNFPCLMQLYQRGRSAAPAALPAAEQSAAATTATGEEGDKATEGEAEHREHREAGIATCAVVTPPPTPGLLPQLSSQAESEGTASRGELVPQTPPPTTTTTTAPPAASAAAAAARSIVSTCVSSVVPHVSSASTVNKAVEDEAEHKEAQQKEHDNVEEDVAAAAAAEEAEVVAMTMSDGAPVSLVDTLRPEKATHHEEEEERVEGQKAEGDTHEEEATHDDVQQKEKDIDDVNKSPEQQQETTYVAREEEAVRPATPPAPSKMLQEVDALPVLSYAEHYTEMEHEPTVQPPEYGKEGQAGAETKAEAKAETSVEETTAAELVCTEHHKLLQGEHWALVRESYKHVFAKEFVDDLVELLHCDPSCVRSVRFAEDDTGNANEKGSAVQIDFTYAHAPQLRQGALDELIARFDFPRLQQLHDCVNVIVKSPTHDESKQKQQQQQDNEGEKATSEEECAVSDETRPHTTEQATLRSAMLSVLSQASLHSRTASLRESERLSPSRPSTAVKSEAAQQSSMRENNEEEEKEEEEVHVVAVEATSPEEEEAIDVTAAAREEGEEGTGDDDEDDATTATTVKESLPDIVAVPPSSSSPTTNDTNNTHTHNHKPLEVVRRPSSGGSGYNAARMRSPDWAALWQDAGSPIPGYEWERSGSVTADKAPHLTSREGQAAKGHHTLRMSSTATTTNSEDMSGADSPEARKLFIDFTSKHRALAAMECGRRNCGLRQPTVSHHRVQLSGEDWSAVLRHAARFLRDQFISEVSECLGCSPECVRNVVLRCSRHRGLLVDCDILHEVSCTNEELNRCLERHHFTLLRELYNSRDELADINVDALLEDDIHLCAYEAETGSSSLSLYRLSRHSLRNGSESRALQPSAPPPQGPGARERGSRSSILRFLTRNRSSIRSTTQTEDSVSAPPPQQQQQQQQQAAATTAVSGEEDGAGGNAQRTRKESAARARGSSLQLPPLIPRTASGSQLSPFQQQQQQQRRKTSSELAVLAALPLSSRSHTPREAPLREATPRSARGSGLLPPLTQSIYPTEASK